MEEENNNKIDTDEILKETSSTFNEVKDQVKESFKKEEFKNSAKETSNFIVGMFKDPIGEMEEIANEESNSKFKYSVILVVIWMVAKFVYALYNLGHLYKYAAIVDNMLYVVKSVCAPLIVIVVLSLIVLILNKNKDKSLIKIMTVTVAAYLPVVIVSVINLLRILSNQAYKIINPIASLCEVISMVLLFFGTKFLFGEEDDRAHIKRFVIVEAIYYLVSFVISFLGISI